MTIPRMFSATSPNLFLMCQHRECRATVIAHNPKGFLLILKKS